VAARAPVSSALVLALLVQTEQVRLVLHVQQRRLVAKIRSHVGDASLKRSRVKSQGIQQTALEANSI
jgi:hypothetical protein